MKNTNSFHMDRPADTRSLSSTTITLQTRVDVGPSRDEIARKAYFIYLDQGCPKGQDRQHWFEAEAQMIAARNVSRQRISAKA